MDVLTAEAAYQEEMQTRKGSILNVFHNPRGLSQLFTKSKSRHGHQAIGAKSDAKQSEQPNQALILKALCGGLDASRLKVNIPTTRGFLASEARALLEQAAANLTPLTREVALQIWVDLLMADQGLFDNDEPAESGPDAGPLSPAIKARHGCWSSTASSADEAVFSPHNTSGRSGGAKAPSNPASRRSTEADKAPLGVRQGSGAYCSRQHSVDTVQDSDVRTIAPARSFMVAAPPFVVLDDNRKSEVNFREVFLRSSALELLVKHFLEEPSLDSEEALLHQLLQLCLVKVPPEQSSGLVDAITKLGTSMLHPHVKPLSRNMLRDIASQAVGSLKVHAELDKLDRQTDEVQTHLTLLLAQWHEWELAGEAGQASDPAGAAPVVQGRPPLAPSLEPLLDSPQWKIAQQVWELASELKGVASQRHAILEHQAAYDYSTLRRCVEDPAACLNADVTSLQLQLDETQAHLQQGTGFRSERFGQVKGVLLGVTSDISRLEGRRAALLAELDKVDDDLKRLYKRQSELEEERNMFEEGSSLTLEGLTAQVEALEASQAAALMEAATLRNAVALVALAADTAEQAGSSSLRESEEARRAATEKVLAAAGRFCRLQHQELSRCIATMQSASDTLTDITTKQMYDDILRQGALEAVAARRQAAIEDYLDAELAAMAILGEVAQVQNSVQICCLSRFNSSTAPTSPASVPTPATSTATPSAPGPAMPTDLATLMPALDALRSQFESFDRPDEVVKFSIAASSGPASSHHPSRQHSASPFPPSQLSRAPTASTPSPPPGGEGPGTPPLEREASGEDFLAMSESTISYSALMDPTVQVVGTVGRGSSDGSVGATANGCEHRTLQEGRSKLAEGRAGGTEQGDCAAGESYRAGRANDALTVEHGRQEAADSATSALPL